MTNAIRNISLQGGVEARQSWTDQKRKSTSKHQKSYLARQDSPPDNVSDEDGIYIFRKPSAVKSVLYPIKIGTQDLDLL